jgi:dTDP-4-dehydrorhamnose reductase
MIGPPANPAPNGRTPMRILVLGGLGMLGHVLTNVLAPQHEVWSTTRDARRRPPMWPGRSFHVIDGVEADSLDSLTRAAAEARPDWIINCVGLVKQRPDAASSLEAIAVNALLPHRLARLSKAIGARLLQISTDCVFSGRRGRYTEDDEPDAIDLYGRSKQLGEVTGPGCLTLRTSIIGREISTSHGLLEWFLRQQGPVSGYTEAYFSGLTTTWLAIVIRNHVLPHPSLTGLYHVAGDRISKHDLLHLIRDAFGLQTAITPADRPRLDRSLDGRRFVSLTGFAAPSWPDMVAGLAAEETHQQDVT